MEKSTPRASRGWHRSGDKPLADTVWFNAVWFQSTWFCAVLGREQLLPLTAVMVLLHLVLTRHRLRAELEVLAALAACGVAVDAALSALGVFRFAGDVLLPGWLVLLWLAFSTTPGRSLAFLHRHWLLTAAVGSIAVPFNYLVGARFGAVELPLGTTTTALILAPVWFVLLPALYRIQSWHSRQRAQGDAVCAEPSSPS